MKHVLSTTLFLFTSINLLAQISIGVNDSPTTIDVKEHNPKDFELLKATTTYFVVPDDLDFKEVEKIMTEIWTFNSIKFINEETFNNNKDEYTKIGTSIIKYIDGTYNYNRYNTLSSSTFILRKFVYDFCKTEKKNSKGVVKRDILNFAEIFFNPNIKLRHEIVSKDLKYKSSLFTTFAKKEDEKNTDEKPGCYNFNLGYIKNYFQSLNDQLTENDNLIIHDGIKNKLKLTELKNKTLFAPDWMLKKYNATKATLDKIITPEELFKEYTYNYKVIPNEELNSKILNGEEFYYLMHTQLNHVKIVSIINSLTGEIIYLDMNSLTYDIKDSDIKDIVKEIDKK